MGIDCIAWNVVDQVGLEQHRLASDVNRKEAEACGENLIKLMGVVLSIEDRDSRSLRSLIRMIFGKKKRSGDRCTRRQGSGPNKKVSTGKAHSVTPNACNARGESSARQTTASVLVSSMLERSG